jgi:hypothetical protein
MGIDYSYDVYVHRRDSRRFLTAVAALCHPDSTETTTVIVPDGDPVTLPGGHAFTSGTTVDLAEIVATLGGTFNLVFSFPADEPLRAYRDGRRPFGHPLVGWTRPADSGPVKMGLIYLGVYDGSDMVPEHWNFSFTPAVTEQSRLFLKSPSIRETFTTLALSTGAALCLFDGEIGDRIIVTAGDRRVSTRVPGPCVLWRGGSAGPGGVAELTAWLSGTSPDEPEWVITAGHPDFRTVVDELVETSRVPEHLWLAPAP